MAGGASKSPANFSRTMALESGEFDFAGKIRRPMPKTFSGTRADWEEWSWNCMFDATVKTLLDDVESRQTVLTNAGLTLALDTGCGQCGNPGSHQL